MTEHIEVSTDKSRLDLIVIHNFLTHVYWATGRTMEQVKKSIENATCFGLYKNGAQIGFARVISDQVALAYLMDVFILEEFRGKGYSKLLLEAIFEHSDFKDVTKWFLGTRDAHGLYRKFGFKELKNPERMMEKKNG
jgi:GNAT superfamily N-acetyltransferase